MAPDGTRQAGSALLLPRPMGYSVLLLNADKITAALAPLICSHFTVWYSSRYPVTIHKHKTPVLWILKVVKEKKKKILHKINCVTKASETDVSLKRRCNFSSLPNIRFEAEYNCTRTVFFIDMAMTLTTLKLK